MHNLNWKIEKIRSLDNEVKEVHPLLKALFDKMPQIKSVIYTQGNRENGADFILVKSDPLLDQDDYVGVVVKSGPIKQNSDDVHRQIKECLAVARPIENGKKFIYLSEVWVITSKDVTRNAEDHLHAEYKTTKIKFIDAEALVKLIDRFLDTYWNLSNIAVNGFVAKQQKIISSISEMHRLIPLEFGRIGVEKDISSNPPDNQRRFNKKKVRHTSLWEEIQSKKLIFLEGGMGSGKSELLRSTANRLCEKVIDEAHNVIPYFTSYKDFVKVFDAAPDSFLEEIHKSIADEKKRIAIFIDGLDESFEETANKVARVCKLAAIINLRNDSALIVASRIIQEESLTATIDSHFDKYKVNPLQLSTIVKFVERICGGSDVSSKLRGDIQKSPLMRVLPRTPLSAILLGKLLKENIFELPATLPELYSKYIELVLGRWDLDKNVGSEKEYETIQRLTSMIATYCLNNDLDTLGVAELKQMFKEYLSERRTGQSLEPMLEMFLQKSELISYDEDTQIVAFRHKSFAEFFYAQALLMEKGKNASLLKPFDPSWSGIEYFYLGLVRDAPERLMQLTKLTPQNKGEQLLKITQFGNFLMAAYQTPYEVIQTTLYDRFVEAAKYYNNLIVSHEEDIFSRLPELQILSIFTYFLRGGYSYEFFKPALLEARIQFEMDSGLSEAERIIAIFFTDAILCELEDESAFVSLVDRYEASLSWTVRLGIYHASADVEFINRTTKQLGKKIDKSMKGNLSLLRYIQMLESTPLRERKDTPENKKK